MRLTCFYLSLAGLACGSSNNNTTGADAAPPIDGSVPTDGAVSTFKGYNADEGGEVKLEYLLTTAGNQGGRVQRFVLKNPGTPAYHPFPVIGACNNEDAAQGLFPTAQNADRVYADPGVVIVSPSDPAATTPPMELHPNAAAGTDSVGRMHPAGMYTVADAAGGPFVGGTSSSGSAYFTEKTLYDVTFTGSTDLPAQVFQKALYMPAKTTLLNPPIGSFPVPAATDQVITMTVPTDEDGLPTGANVHSIAAFAGPAGLSEFCVYDTTAGHSVEITAAAADIIRAKYPTGGTMARMDSAHVVQELTDFNGPTGRRVDFIAQWCNSTPFTVP